MEKVVEIKNLTKIYKNGFEVKALDNVTLDIFRGDFVSIVGPSGSGKTTFLNILSGLDVPTSGSIIIEGHDITRESASKVADIRRTRLGFVFQSFNLIPVFSALENVEFALILRGVEKEERLRKARASGATEEEVQALARQAVADGELAPGRPKAGELRQQMQGLVRDMVAGVRTAEVAGM